MNELDWRIQLQQELTKRGVPIEMRPAIVSHWEQVRLLLEPHSLKLGLEETMRLHKCNVREAAARLGVSKTKAYEALGKK